MFNVHIQSKVKTHWFLSYHRLLDVIHMVTLTHFLEGNPLPPHRLLFSISSNGIFYMHFSIDRTVHTTAFDKPVVDHRLERKIAQTAAGSTEKDRSDDRPLQRRARYRLSYIPLLTFRASCCSARLLCRALRDPLYREHYISQLSYHIPEIDYI